MYTMVLDLLEECTGSRSTKKHWLLSATSSITAYERRCMTSFLCVTLLNASYV